MVSNILTDLSLVYLYFFRLSPYLPMSLKFDKSNKLCYFENKAIIYKMIFFLVLLLVCSCKERIPVGKLRESIEYTGIKFS